MYYVVAMPVSILIVDADRHLGEKLVALARRAGFNVVSRSTFDDAQADIKIRTPSFLVTSVHVGSCSGMHLAHALRRASAKSRALIYGSPADLVFAREGRHRHTFYERETFIPYSLTRFLTSALPAEDRRDIRRIDRRDTFRGGRRATDIETLHKNRRRPGVGPATSSL